MAEEMKHCDRCDMLVDVRVHEGLYVRDPLEWICLTCAELEGRSDDPNPRP